MNKLTLQYILNIYYNITTGGNDMSKVNFFNEPKAYKEQISRYFPDTIPVTFDHLKEQFNITIFGMDIPLLKKLRI